LSDLAKTTRPRKRLRIGPVWVDALTFDEALNEIEILVESRRGGSVFTPNVDHVVKADANEPFRRAYEAASLSLADGMPLVWVGRLLGRPLPERVAGSDLLLPLLQLAARRRWRVYLLGGAPGVAAAVAKLLTEEMGVCVVGWDDARINSDGSDQDGGGTISRAAVAKPDLVFVGLGPPKQEIWIHRATESLGPAVSFGVGASLDFLAGKFKRAPRWVSRIGFEWAYRLVQEPRRLWRRYLVDDPRFALIVINTMLSPKSSRLKELPARSERPGKSVYQRSDD
jgi:N-acetylglucosaminyldiphosphoundecaprenol N-acetyl-beta-D-mannosaminyltransferase